VEQPHCIAQKLGVLFTNESLTNPKLTLFDVELGFGPVPADCWVALAMSCKEYFQIMDTDNSGKVTYASWVKWWHRHTSRCLLHLENVLQCCTCSDPKMAMQIEWYLCFM
jgi:hypothetical protein